MDFPEAYLNPRLLALQRYMESLGYPQALRTTLEYYGQPTVGQPFAPTLSIEQLLFRVEKAPDSPPYLLPQWMFVFDYTPQRQKFWNTVIKGGRP